MAAQIAALTVAPDTGDKFELNAIAVAEGWAVGTAQAASDDGDPTGSEYVVLIAHETDSGWEINTDRSTADFCRLLADAPDSVVDSNMRTYFLGCP